VTKVVDVVLVGGGIMSATLGSLIRRLEPQWTIAMFERGPELAPESSNPWNNAGTGHSALCELNYTPEQPDGSVAVTSALKVNSEFQLSREYWSALVEDGTIPDPTAFLVPVPHISFVWGAANVAYLKARHEALKNSPLFPGAEFTDDPRVIHEWAPLVMPGRPKDEPVAATRFVNGTDIDFGSLTNILVDSIAGPKTEVHINHSVQTLKRRKDGLWAVTVRQNVGRTPKTVLAKFVFVGAGGHALNLLQRAGIPEIRGFAGFPVSGQFYRCDNPEVVARHNAKVYGKAAVGAPPMSVPHLDTRVVDGQSSLLFGPYAGFTPKFLKAGSLWDLPLSIRLGNLIPMLAVAVTNLGLVQYLATEVFAGRAKRIAALREYFPEANPADWYGYSAGQRVQVIAKDKAKGGVLKFGTEVVAHKDGSIAGLLGASPGASTSVAAMLDVLATCFPAKKSAWAPKLKALVPSYGKSLSTDAAAARASLTRTAAILGIH
jgi:malate dehydrogenase (quinone)